VPEDDPVPEPEAPRPEDVLDPVPLVVSSIRCCCLPEPLPIEELFIDEPVPVLEDPVPEPVLEDPIAEPDPDPVDEDDPDCALTGSAENAKARERTISFFIKPPI
jgi:hypothetical protein